MLAAEWVRDVRGAGISWRGCGEPRWMAGTWTQRASGARRR